MDRSAFITFYETRDKDLRDRIIEENLNLVKYIARKFSNRGEPLADVIQVGTMGLMKAIERYDPSHDVEFATYATPTIVGEIKHFFRDKTHLIKIPRRLHELNAKIKKVIYDLSRDEGRSPTIQEIAVAVNSTEEEVLESLEAGQAYMPLSLDTPAYVSERSGESSSSSKASLMDTIKHANDEDMVITRESLRHAISEHLSQREQRIIYLRFYDNLSQSDIAQILNLSQMHISRLLNNALAKLRKSVVR